MKTLKAFTLILMITAIQLLSSCNDDDLETAVITCDSNSFEQQQFHVNLSEDIVFEAQNYPDISCYDYSKKYASYGFGAGCGGVEREYYYFREEMSLDDEQLGKITFTFYKAFWVDEIDFNEPNWRLKSLFQGEVKFFHERTLSDISNCYDPDDNLLDVLLSDGLPTVVSLSFADNKYNIFSSVNTAQGADASFTVDQFELVDFEGVPSRIDLSENKIHGFNGIVTGKVTCNLLEDRYCNNPDQVVQLTDVSFRLPIDVRHIEALPAWCD